MFVLAASSAPAVPRRLRRLLDASGCAWQARVETVASVEDAVARLRPGDAEIPVAVGGDGTANLLAQALRRTVERPILGLLPLGTGNALAHALGVGTPTRALAALRAGAPRAADVIATAHPVAQLALATLSAGFEGRFIARYARWRRRGRMLAGAGAFLLECGHASDPLRVIADGQDLTADLPRVYNAGFYNIPCYAGGRRVWPAADPCDGRGEAVLCATAGAYWRAVAGGDPGAARIRGWTTAVLESPGPIQFDGESTSGTTLELRLEPGALAVLAPPALITRDGMAGFAGLEAARR